MFTCCGGSCVPWVVDEAAHYIRWGGLSRPNKDPWNNRKPENTGTLPPAKMRYGGRLVWNSLAQGCPTSGLLIWCVET